MSERVKGMVTGDCLHGLRRNIDGHEHALTLQPFCSQPIFVVCPLAIAHRPSRRRLERPRTERKSLNASTPDHSGAWRRAGVGEYGQNAPFARVSTTLGPEQVPLPCRAGKVHVRDLFEDCVGPDIGKMVIDSISSLEVPLQEAHHSTAASKVSCKCRHSASPDFDFRSFPGGHHYLRDSAGGLLNATADLLGDLLTRR